MNAQQIITEYGLKFRIEPISERPDAPDWEANHYRFKLAAGRHSFSGYYSMGYGLKGEPKPAEVLECLLSDAQARQESFEDFCCNFGYDEDSRKAEKTWKACQRTYVGLSRVLGEENLLGLFETGWEEAA